MSAYGTPAAAGHDGGPWVPDRRDWLRLLGGVMFAAGAAVLAIRKGTEWSDWALLALLAFPCLLLYVLAFAGRRAWPVVQGWQAAFLAFATLLLPLALFQFLTAIDGNTSDELNVAWIFALSAAVAVVCAVVTAARWQMLIGAVYAFVAWLALWSKVLDEISEDRLRGILAGFGLIVLLLAVLTARRRAVFTSDLVTVAGIAWIATALVGLAGLVSDAVDLEGVLPEDARPEQGWNILLVGVSLLLIAYGSRSVTRGPSYVGAIGLLIFIGVVGQDVVSLFNGEEGQGVAGWPLILLIGGGAALAASFFLPRRGGPTTEPGLARPRAPGAAAGEPGPSFAPSAQPGAPAQPQPEPGRPPQGGGGGSLLEQWRTQPPPGGQPPPE
jgi:hypothetical protein